MRFDCLIDDEERSNVPLSGSFAIDINVWQMGLMDLIYKINILHRDDRDVVDDDDEFVIERMIVMILPIVFSELRDQVNLTVFHSSHLYPDRPQTLHVSFDLDHSNLDSQRQLMNP